MEEYRKQYTEKYSGEKENTSKVRDRDRWVETRLVLKRSDGPPWYNPFPFSREIPQRRRERNEGYETKVTRLNYYAPTASD